MSTRIRTQTHTPHSDDDADDLPPPYTLNPTDEVTLELGPARPFQRPPQQQPRQQLQQRQQRQARSEFAQDFYAAGGGASRSADTLPHRPPPQPLQTQSAIPDDGRPTRTPVPGHPLLNSGKTLVYPAGYECHKCMSLPFHILSAPVDGSMMSQATTLATSPSIPPTLVANAGINIRNPIQAPSPMLLGTTVRPIGSDLYCISDRARRTPA